MRYFLALERTGSAQAAADLLRTSTTTVSRKISAISERLNEQVVVKTNNQWVLTLVGRRVFDIGVKLEKSIADFGDGYISGEHVGEIMITSLDFINRTILFLRLHDFHTNYPAIKSNFHSSNANLSLAFGEANVAIRLARPTSGRLHAKKLFEVKIANVYFKTPPVLRVTDQKAAPNACKNLRLRQFP